ncbi:hypothetical protein PITCH_A270015 [uncultured Desulfobacterium sp.]|uniref:Uncharacterized protein n=1 Tax=uncultured Desulfobacterium sp. TaxID=201089 RepID=A0A445MYV4_9BACT|nr:hypothetical protein PITCH_A270015 [uncultured Desulfobacterium sp.]
MNEIVFIIKPPDYSKCTLNSTFERAFCQGVFVPTTYLTRGPTRPAVEQGTQNINCSFETECSDTSPIPNKPQALQKIYSS